MVDILTSSQFLSRYINMVNTKRVLVDVNIILMHFFKIEILVQNIGTLI